MIRSVEAGRRSRVAKSGRVRHAGTMDPPKEGAMPTSWRASATVGSSDRLEWNNSAGGVEPRWLGVNICNYEY